MVKRFGDASFPAKEEGKMRTGPVWKRLVVGYSVYLDALASHENNLAILAHLASKRKEIGSLSRSEVLEMAAAERKRDIAIDKTTYLQAREKANAEYAQAQERTDLSR